MSTVVSLPLSLAHNSYYSHDCTPIAHTSWALVQRRGKTIKWKDLYSGVKHSATTKRAVAVPLYAFMSWPGDNGASDNT